MPLLSGLSQRAAAQRRAEERIRRAGEEMRTAPLPELAVQPARRGDAPAAPTPAAVVPLPRAPVVITETPRAPVVPAPVLIGVRQGPAGPANVHPIVIDLRDSGAADAQSVPPEPELIFHWDTADQLLRRLPRLSGDDRVRETAADGLDDADELRRRLAYLDADDQVTAQGEFPIVLEVAGLMSSEAPSAAGYDGRRER